MSDTQSYAEYKEELEAEQSGMSPEQLKEHLKSSKQDIIADLDSMPKVEHRWIDRGAVMSCEGANHPNHHAWKR